MEKKILIIGAGPAGLTAAWEAEKKVSKLQFWSLIR